MTILGALITGWDWLAVAAFLIGGLIWLAWEIRGIVNHDEHLVDTISELYWQLRDRMGPVRTVLATVLAGFFIWLWWHLTFQGRNRARTRTVRAFAEVLNRQRVEETPIVKTTEEEENGAP